MRSSGDGFTSCYASVNFNASWGGHANPGGLYIEHFQQGIVVLVEENGCACGGPEFHRSPDVIDVCVGDDDLFDLEVVLADERENVFDFIARVDHHSFARGLVADDRAIALQRAYREDFVDHRGIVASPE